MADKDWTRAVLDGLRALGERIRGVADAIGEALSPEPARVPVPVTERPPRRR